MRKGQVGFETVAIIGIIVVVLFLSTAVTLKRGGDIEEYDSRHGIRTTVEEVSLLISSAQVHEGAIFNVSLPAEFPTCEPEYRVLDGRFAAICDDEEFSEAYIASGLTNGTSGPPFAVAGDITIQRIEGEVTIT